jgi:hypothetical protein
MEYSRLANDLCPSATSISTVITGPNVKLIDLLEDDDCFLESVPSIDLPAAISLLIHTMISTRSSKLVIVLNRHCYSSEDVMSTLGSMLPVEAGLGHVDVTLIRFGPGPSFSAMLPSLTIGATTITSLVFTLPTENMIAACTELAMRHMQLRTIKVRIS